MKQEPEQKSLPNQQPDADALLAMIEELMAGGSGHLVVSDTAEDGGLQVNTYRSMDCGLGNQACCQPTEFMDD